MNCFFTPIISKDIATFSKESPMDRFRFPKNGIKPNSPDYIHGHDRAPKMDLKDDFMLSHQGSLIHWAKQGVLMIDTALTVNAPTYHTFTQLMKIKLSRK